MKKKILLVIAMVAVLVCTLAVTINAASTTVGGVKYNINEQDGTASIADNRQAFDTSVTEVIIPSTITYNDKEYTVVAIENEGFRGQTSIKTIYFPPTITSIGTYGISGCSNLERIYIDFEVLVNLGQLALTTGTAPGGYSDVKEDLLIYATSEYGKENPTPTKKADFVAIKSIGAAALQGLNVEELVLGENLETLSIQSFRGARIKSLLIKSTKITTFNHYMFNICTLLETIEIWSAPTFVDNDVFSGCKSVKTIKIDLSKCETINGSAFEFSEGCQGGNAYNNTTMWYNLEGKNIVDLSSVTSIGGEAFGTSNLGAQKVIWPKSLSSISDQAFRKANLKEIYINVASGKTIELPYWAFNGNQLERVVIVGDATCKAIFTPDSGKTTTIVCTGTISFTQSNPFSNDGSKLYYTSFVEGTTTDFNNCEEIQITSAKTSATVCGIDCSVVVGNETIELFKAVHTENGGIANDAYCPLGSVVDYTCIYCDFVRTEKQDGAKEGHEHTVAVITYENGFFMAGTITHKCSSEGCVSTSGVVNSVLPIFTEWGYTVAQYGQGSVMQGFVVNEKALSDYNDANKDAQIADFGVIAGTSLALGENTDVFAENGELTTNKVAQKSFMNQGFAIFEMKISGFNQTVDVNGTPLDLTTIGIYNCGYYLIKKGESYESYYMDQGSVTEILPEAFTFASKM